MTGAAPRHVAVRGVTFGNDLPLVLIAGPCQLETLDHALSIAEPLAQARRRGPPRMRLDALKLRLLAALRAGARPDARET